MTTRALAPVSGAMALLLLNLTAVLALTGIIWFVQVVHYPLFQAVGDSSWEDYHREHSRRTTWVVIGPMVIDLATSFALLADRPAGVSLGLALAGAAMALATWGATFALAVPAHRELADGPRRPVIARLVRDNWIRTAAWSLHAGIALAMLAQAG